MIRGTHRARRSGQGMVEYGLILGLMVVMVITMFVMFKNMTSIGTDASGALSVEGMARNQASISAAMY